VLTALDGVAVVASTLLTPYFFDVRKKHFIFVRSAYLAFIMNTVIQYSLLFIR
jgi:hypothetical protein